MKSPKFKTVFKEERHGKNYLGIEIKIATDKSPDLNQRKIYDAIHRGAENIKAEICAEIRAKDPETEKSITQNKALLEVFAEPIFVEEIPNRYCSDWCCRHLPWFVVTTKVGRIMIGWRKRVIEISWTDTNLTESGYIMFSEDTCTIGADYIHAWSIEKAKEYINTLLTWQKV